jgi:hypothetical protein
LNYCFDSLNFAQSKLVFVYKRENWFCTFKSLDFEPVISICNGTLLVYVDGSRLSKNNKLLSNELPFSVQNIQHFRRLVRCHFQELPSILVSIAQGSCRQFFGCIKFLSLALDVSCNMQVCFDSFLSQDAKSTREKNARIIFSLVIYFAAK